MFEARLDILQNGRVHKHSLSQNGACLSYAAVLTAWQSDRSFRSFFLALLAESPFPAFCWETPPLTNKTLERGFEFVLIDSPWLAAHADPQAFSSYFSNLSLDEGIVTCANLGGDASLVIPAPRGSNVAYSHLAAFTRHGPKRQTHALWKTVGEVMENAITDQPIWLSTAGGGVAWLHVRLDSRPKYYGFQPYKEYT